MRIKPTEKECYNYPLVICYIAIEHNSFIVDLPIKNGDEWMIHG